MANGAFQIRLTHNLIPLDNAVPSFPYVFRTSLGMELANLSQEIRFARHVHEKYYLVREMDGRLAQSDECYLQ